MPAHLNSMKPDDFFANRNTSEEPTIRISSRLTGLEKAMVFVPAVLVLTVILTDTVDTSTRLIGCTALLLLALVYRAFFAPLCSVTASPAGLHVRRKRTVVFIPFTQLWSVSRVLHRRDTVEVVLREPAPGIGRSFQFVAPMRLISWGDPPVLAFLQSRIPRVGEAAHGA